MSENRFWLRVEHSLWALILACTVVLVTAQCHRWE